MVKGSMSHVRSCQPRCEFFRCGQRSLAFRSEIAWCRFAEDRCEPGGCKFAQCLKGKLLTNGVCGLTLKARTLELTLDSVGQPIKAPGKLARKLKERELF
jgi:hypothetical protein